MTKKENSNILPFSNSFQETSNISGLLRSDPKEEYMTLEITQEIYLSSTGRALEYKKVVSRVNPKSNVILEKDVRGLETIVVVETTLLVGSENNAEKIMEVVNSKHLTGIIQYSSTE